MFSALNSEKLPEYSAFADYIYACLQVKDNFERFISCKSTIDDIHLRLRKAEVEYGEGADGASTADMVDAVTDVSFSDTLHHAFTLLLDPQFINLEPCGSSAQCVHASPCVHATTSRAFPPWLPANNQNKSQML